MKGQNTLRRLVTRNRRQRASRPQTAPDQSRRRRRIHPRAFGLRILDDAPKPCARASSLPSVGISLALGLG